MREILFRGKQENNEWAKGSLIIWGDGSCSIESGSLTEPMASVNPETVGQFTGLTDKYGTKIFEDDTCRASRPCVVAYGHIEFKNGCFWFVDNGPGGMLRLCDVRMNGFTIEVIGNIYDNPELL